MPESIPIWEKEYGSVNRTWATCKRKVKTNEKISFFFVKLWTGFWADFVIVPDLKHS